MKTFAVAWILVFPFMPSALAAGDTPEKYARLLDRERDTVVRRDFVPNKTFTQGEVRLIRRDGAAVMQTVLYSSFLKYVVGEIGKKESSSWPPGREGHDDSVKYIDAVRNAQSRIEDRFKKRTDRRDGRRKMLIEFILTDKESIVAICEPELSEGKGDLRIVSAVPMTFLDLSRRYVTGNFYEIAKDALKLSAAEAKALLDPMLPREQGAKEGASGRFPMRKA